MISIKKIITKSCLIILLGNQFVAAAESVPVKSPTEDVSAGEALVFRGIAFERYNIPEILKLLKIKKTSYFTITNRTPALNPENQFRLDKLPQVNPKKASQYIIMADFPLNAGVMPDIAMKSIIKDIKRGSTLVILGGLFTLNKGEFNKTCLTSILPVETENVWAVKKLKFPITTPGGNIVYIHDIHLTSGANVIYESGSQPLWVAKKCEKGQVIVFLGIPSGTDKDAAGLFWKNQAWIKFAVDMINKGEK